MSEPDGCYLQGANAEMVKFAGVHESVQIFPKPPLPPPESTANLHAFELACVVLLLMTRGTPAAQDAGTPQPCPGTKVAERHNKVEASGNISQYQREALH